MRGKRGIAREDENKLVHESAFLVQSKVSKLLGVASSAQNTPVARLLILTKLAHSTAAPRRLTWKASTWNAGVLGITVYQLRH